MPNSRRWRRTLYAITPYTPTIASRPASPPNSTVSADIRRGCPTDSVTTCSIVCTALTGSAGSIDATICRAVGIIDVGSSAVVRMTTVIDGNAFCSMVR